MSKIMMYDTPIAGSVNAAYQAYDNSTSHLAATSVQGAIDEVNGNVGDLDATDIAYDNTTSGLEATKVQGAVDEIFQNIYYINRRTRRQLSSTDLTNLKSGISAGDFTGTNIKDGDYFSGASGFKYTLGDFNHFKGNTTQRSVISSNHYAMVVDCMGTTAWNSAGNCTGAYKGSTLRTYLRDTALPSILTDMQALGFNVLSRQCLESNAFDTSRVNRWGQSTGCSTGSEWISEQIIALSEPNVYGCVIAGSSFFDVGEANRQLNCFKEHSFMDIFDMKYPWLKEPSASGRACAADGDTGAAYGNSGVTNTFSAFGLIVIN